MKFQPEPKKSQTPDGMEHLDPPLEFILRAFANISETVTDHLRPDEKNLVLTTAVGCILVALPDGGAWPAPPEEMTREELLFAALLVVGSSVLGESQRDKVQTDRAREYAREVIRTVFHRDESPIWRQ